MRRAGLGLAMAQPILVKCRDTIGNLRKTEVTTGWGRPGTNWHRGLNVLIMQHSRISTISRSSRAVNRYIVRLTRVYITTIRECECSNMIAFIDMFNIHCRALLHPVRIRGVDCRMSNYTLTRSSFHTKLCGTRKGNIERCNCMPRSSRNKVCSQRT